jgi:hypothetical protein
MTRKKPLKPEPPGQPVLMLECNPFTMESRGRETRKMQIFLFILFCDNIIRQGNATCTSGGGESLFSLRADTGK